jgi:hypothetical protein
MQKPHAAARLIREALSELAALGVRNAGGDGFADGFPVAALAGLNKAKTGAAAAGQGRLGGLFSRQPNMKQNACWGILS